ncbi:MAG: type IV pilus assembly protein PilM [Gaiellaceae bacterium]
MRASVADDIDSGGAQEKVPFYKREITFSRKKRPPKTSVSAAAIATVPKSANVPFYKREITFGRKKKQPAPMVQSPGPQAAPAATPVPAPAPAQAQVPFYKREISFKRKPRPAAAERVVAPSVPAREAPADVVEDTAESVAAPAPAPARPPAPKQKVPFYKREISFGRSGPSAVTTTKSTGAARRQKALVGVKIGASGISAARVVQNGGRPELLELVREPLARGVVVAGEVRDVPALATALANMFSVHRLPKKAVRLGISNNRIGVRIIEVSGVMQPRQLENAIRFRAQEVLPIALEDAVLDYQQLSESVNADGELVRRVLLVVAYRDLVDRYVVAFKEAGVRLVGIDLEAFGLLRALTPGVIGERSDAAHVVVSIGHERSTFAVSDGNVCEFTRVLEWGGSTLDVAIARQLNLAPSEAEPVKHAIALDGSELTLPPNVTREQANLAADIVRRQLQTFARELVSSLQYYQNQPSSLGIGDIVITGGTSLLPGLAGELQRLIGVSVRVGDPFERVRVARGVVAGENQRALATAIGLAIEE